MTSFLSISNQMLFLFTCILVGFILNKSRVLPRDADVILSRLVSYVAIPAMVIKTFRAHCTPANLRADAFLLLVILAVTLIGMAISYLAAPYLTKKKENYGVFRYAITLSNFGFVGNPLVLALLGEEALFHFLIITLPGTLYAYTIGMIDLTTGQQKFRPSMLLTPSILSMGVGIFMGLTSMPLPAFLEKAIGSLQDCYSPLAMLMTGIVIGHYNPLKLLKEKEIYVLSFLRLIVLPLFFLGLCKLIRLDAFATQMTVFYTAMPVGLNTIIFPAAFGGDETPGAAMAIISNLIGLITVPLIVGLVL